MSDQELARLAEAGSRLLLQPPDARMLAALAPLTHAPLDLRQAQQDFYDFLCTLQSGCFLPPYAHVLTQAEETEEFWHFPPARYDGGDALLPWYDAAGFNPLELQAAPMLTTSNRPLDHVGVLLAFLALLLDASKDSEVDRQVLADFITEHIQPWADVFAHLLTQAGSAYISLVGEALGDFFAALRTTHPPHAIAENRNGKPRLIPIRPAMSMPVANSPAGAVEHYPGVGLR